MRVLFATDVSSHLVTSDAAAIAQLPSSLSDEGSLEDLQGHRQPAALMREGGVLDAATAPLPKGVLLAIKSLDEEQDAAARGVAVALLILLEDYTKPGWLPAAIDEQCTPLCGLMAPIPSFCFTEKCNGFVPTRVVCRFPHLAPNLAISAHRPHLVDTKPCILLNTARCISSCRFSSTASA